MKNTYIRRFLWIIPFCGALWVQGQPLNNAESTAVQLTGKPIAEKINIDQGLRNHESWRSTGASFTILGSELERMTTGNLLNTLQGRIPGLTVMTGSGEPGYDNPTLIGRGLSSWNLTGNNVLIYLDGFQVNMNAIAALSVHEVQSVTYLKDASSLAVYGLDGGTGALVITTKRGAQLGKTQITVNGRYGLQSIVDLPTVLNAYDYTRLHNQARQNDGLTMRYANPDLYKNGGDVAHPDVDWYSEVLQPLSRIQDYNLSFRGGGKSARYFVLTDYTQFSGNYKNANEISDDFGTNAQYTKINLRGNVEIDVTPSFSVNAQIAGVVEDKNTPAGFTAPNLFNNLMQIPAAAFSVKNPDGTWGNSSVYKFNPVMLLKTGGIWNSHTRNLQTNFTFNQKLDALTPGLSLRGGLSFSNQYVGYTEKKFTNLSYELLKDDTDSPVLDALGNYTYAEVGEISNAINEGETSHWNRSTYQLGLNYDRSWGKHSVTGMLLARRHSYSYNSLVYEIRNQGLSLSATYDYDQRYVVDLSAGYTGSADFEKGNRYGLFPALGLGWIASNEAFLKESQTVQFLKVRASAGLTGNTNNGSRFLYEQWASSNNGWRFTNSNSWYTGWREGAIPNADFSWEQKASVNFGVDAKIYNKLNVNLDVFTEKRTGILENATANVPDYTGFRLANMNTGVVRNSGFEAVVGYDDHFGLFNFYAKGMVSFARNQIVEKAETVKPHDWLYEEGYRINQNRGLMYDGFYQVEDFTSEGLLKEGVVVSTFANAQPGDLKFKDQNNDGLINDYDKVPYGFTDIPEVTLGLNLGFKYKGFDFDAFFQGVTNRTVVLPNAYTHPFVDNNNITQFSLNAWTPETAQTATSPRLTTQNNGNNSQDSDFYMRDGSFIKLRSVELGYTFSSGKIKDIRVFLNGTNLFTWDQIEDLEAERLSSGYPLVKSVSLGLKVNF